MKAGWTEIQLGEIAELRGRIGWKGLTAKEYTKWGPRFLSVHSLNYGDYVDFRDAFHISQERYDESPEIMLQRDDILICKDGAGIGKLGVVPEVIEPTTINSSLLLIRPSSEVLPKFLYFCLLSPYFQEIVQSRLEGATTPHLYQRDITTFPIFLPPLEEQQRIVAVLDEALEGLARARAHAEANLQNARELFDRAAFELFENLRTERTTLALGELAEKITKGSSPKWQGISYVEEPGILFITSENVGKNEIDLTKTKYVEEAFNEKDRKSILAKGDVLTNIVGASIGRTAVFELDEVANINQAVCMIRCDPARLKNHYLSYLLNSPYFKAQLHAGEVNMARANLSLTFFRELQVPVPPLNKQDETVQEIEALRHQTSALELDYQSKLQDLDDLRQSLLQKAFAGELT